MSRLPDDNDDDYNLARSFETIERARVSMVRELRPDRVISQVTTTWGTRRGKWYAEKLR